MSVDQPDASWAFVIDTDSYAGNFERDMCAFVTGIIGECGVGADMIAHFNKCLAQYGWKENPFEDIILQVADEHGCQRPASIYPNPKWANHGMGESFRIDDPDYDKKALASYVEEIEMYYTRLIDQTKACKPVPKDKAKEGDWTEEAIAREIKRYTAEIEKAKKLKKPYRYTSFNSVVIFFAQKPSKELIDLMKKRAQEYVDSPVSKHYPNTEKITIEGFRMVHKTAKFKEETA